MCASHVNKANPQTLSLSNVPPGVQWISGARTFFPLTSESISIIHCAGSTIVLLPCVEEIEERRRRLVVQPQLDLCDFPIPSEDICNQKWKNIWEWVEGGQMENKTTNNVRPMSRWLMVGGRFPTKTRLPVFWWLNLVAC